MFLASPLTIRKEIYISPITGIFESGASILPALSPLLQARESRVPWELTALPLKLKSPTWQAWQSTSLATFISPSKATLSTGRVTHRRFAESRLGADRNVCRLRHLSTGSG